MTMGATKKDIEVAISNVCSLLPTEGRKRQCALMYAASVYNLDKATASCNFREVAQYFREMGEEAVAFEKSISDLPEKTRADVSEAVGSKLWGVFDDMVANALMERCGCKKL